MEGSREYLTARNLTPSLPRLRSELLEELMPEGDLMLIEKRIRAVQKKLRRVQEIESKAIAAAASGAKPVPSGGGSAVGSLGGGSGGGTGGSCGSGGCSGSGGLDAGQQALLASKPLLKSELQQLLRQWAMIEPVLREQQEMRLAAIGDSECAVCLDEYDQGHPPIRTTCCGYHFHHPCLQQCLEQKGQCPICGVERKQCKVLAQRRS